jgi:hypothetical protein
MRIAIWVSCMCIFASVGKCENRNRATQNMPLRKKKQIRILRPKKCKQGTPIRDAEKNTKQPLSKSTPGEYYNMCLDQGYYCCCHGCDNREWCGLSLAMVNGPRLPMRSIPLSISLPTLRLSGSPKSGRAPGSSSTL